MKIAGSGSVSQRHGSADPYSNPDPHQNVMDRQCTGGISEYRIQKLMYINYQCTCFLKWRLDLLILMGANTLLGTLEGVGPKNLDSFGPKSHSLRFLSFLGPKKINFQGLHPFQWPSKWICPHKNHYSRANNRYIISYCWKRLFFPPNPKTNPGCGTGISVMKTTLWLFFFLHLYIL
jgi:hypothetical protein